MKKIYLMIIGLLLVCYFSAVSYADTTYTIKKGDNPYTIGKKFRVGAQEIIRLNHLKAGNLKPGTKITIPSREQAKKGQLRKEAAAEANKEKKTARKAAASSIQHHDDAQFHTVKKGDTLTSISRKYSVSVGELKEFNSLASIRIKPGQKLIVRQTGQKVYIAKKGDTVYRIAKKFNLDVEDIKSFNDLDTEALKPGQKILLEQEAVSVDVKTYDAVISEAANRDMSAEVTQVEDSGMTGRIIVFARKLINIPYRFGGNSLLGIDCSGFVKKVYGMVGIDLPRSARQQFQEGTPIEKDDLSIGDLVFFKTYASFPSHVGIYLGNNLFIHASSHDKKVTIDSLDIPYYFKRFIGARRFIEGNEQREVLPKEG